MAEPLNPKNGCRRDYLLYVFKTINDNTSHYNRTTKTYEARFLVKNSDLLFAWAASLGTYIWEGGNAWLNQHIFKVEPYSFVNKKFLYYAFKLWL